MFIYTYDHTGTRAIRSHGPLEGVYINGAEQGLDYHDADNYTLYVSPYLIVNNDRFTKHYYAGTQRIASKVGSGDFYNVYGVNGFHLTAGQKDYEERLVQMEEGVKQYYRENGIPPGVPTQKGSNADPYVTGTALPNVPLGNYDVPSGWPTSVKFNEPGDVPGPPVQFESDEMGDPGAGYGFESDHTYEGDWFFFHTDHLGSTSYLTDTAGNVSQFVCYTPYGEAIVDEHLTTYENPFKFSGKELDDITGLYDHGARSRNPISTLWYGVDPRYEEFPEMSPFAYCHGNPVRLIDPDGRGDEETGGIPAERNEDGTHIEARASTYVPFNIPPMTQHGNTKTEHSNRNEYDQNYGETVWGENISQDAVQSKAKNRGPNQDMVAMGSNEVGAFFLFGQWISKFFRSDSDEENGNSSATQSSTSQVPTQTVQTPKRDTIKVQLETRQHARDIFSDDAIIVDTIYEKQYRMNGKVVKRDTIKVKMKR